LRRLRITAPVQLPLPISTVKIDELWAVLPEATKTLVLGLLARLIAKGVVEDDE